MLLLGTGCTPIEHETFYSPDDGSMLAHSRRRWTNLEPHWLNVLPAGLVPHYVILAVCQSKLLVQRLRLWLSNKPLGLSIDIS